MKMSITKFVVALAAVLILTAATTASQSRAQYCVPQYDPSGAQRAPYC
jgi:hypothetical protein